MRVCIMIVRLKIGRRRLNKIVDLMTWDRVHYFRATWTHQELPILIEWTKNDAIMGRGIVAHNHCTIAAVDRSSPNRMARISRGNFSLKTDVFSSST